MKTVLFGKVTEQHLADALLFAGIEPSEYITNGKTVPPASQRATTVIPPCPMVPGEPGELQNNWRLVLHADALICVGDNPHLVECAARYDLLIYEVAQ